MNMTTREEAQVNMKMNLMKMKKKKKKKAMKSRKSRKTHLRIELTCSRSLLNWKNKIKLKENYKQKHPKK
jgi:hypothetical protein